MRCNPQFARAQQGAILVVSVLLLLVMTVLALTASQTTRLQERMAGNARDLDMAFQAGEAGLRAAEIRIDGTVGPQGENASYCTLSTNIQECDAADRTVTTFEFDERNVEWWEDNSIAMDDDLAQIEVLPHFYTEQWHKVKDSFVQKPGASESGTIFYVNTSRAQGATDTAVTMIEATYAVRYSN